MFDLQDLESFIAVAEHRSFGRAATALGISQPSLSRRISLLERHIGAVLFSRERRQIELSGTGEVLLREARAVIAQATLAERILREAVSGTSGGLRFGTRSASRYVTVPTAIRSFHRMCPSVNVTVVDPVMAIQIDLLRRGMLDITVIRGAIKLEGGLRAKPLRSDPLVVVLPEDHPFATRGVVNVADLAGEPFVELTWYEDVVYKELARAVCAAAGFVPRVVQQADSFDSLLLCVASGMGVACVHDASHELPVPCVVYRPLEPEPPQVPLHAVWRDDDPNPALTPFVEALAAAAARPLPAPSRN
jgi:DNA-binding transcriptional LysR family regulator